MNPFSKQYVPTVGTALQILEGKKNNAMGRNKSEPRHFLGMSPKADQAAYDQMAMQTRGDK